MTLKYKSTLVGIIALKLNDNSILEYYKNNQQIDIYDVLEQYNQGDLRDPENLYQTILKGIFYNIQHEDNEFEQQHYLNTIENIIIGNFSLISESMLTVVKSLVEVYNDIIR